MRNFLHRGEEGHESKKDLLIWIPITLALTLAGLHFLFQ